MSFQKRTLFLGDLPIFCSELDLENLFVPFGDIYEIRLKVDKTTQRNLSYGFVKFVIPECAQKALEALDGQRLQGRAIKVRWASNGPNDDDSINSNRNSIQIQVSYVSRRKDLIVNENTLRTLFSCYGEVLDVSIKKSSVVKEDSGSQSGYGFVHFANTPTGVCGALAAVKAVQNVTVDRVTYDCHLSHRCCKELPSLLNAQDNQENQTASAAEKGTEPDQKQESQQHMKRSENIDVADDIVMRKESRVDGTAVNREENSVSSAMLNRTFCLATTSVENSACTQVQSNSFKSFNETQQQEILVPRPQTVHPNVQKHVRGAVFSGANLLPQSFASVHEPSISYPTSPNNYSCQPSPTHTRFTNRVTQHEAFPQLMTAVPQSYQVLPMHPHMHYVQQVESCLLGPPRHDQSYHQMHYQHHQHHQHHQALMSGGQSAHISRLTSEQCQEHYQQKHQQLQFMEEYVCQQLVSNGQYYPAPPQTQPMQIAPALQQHHGAHYNQQQPSSPTSIAASVLDSQNFATRGVMQVIQQTPPLSPQLSPPPLFRTLSCVEISQQPVCAAVYAGQQVFDWHAQQFAHIHLQEQQNYV